MEKIVFICYIFSQENYVLEQNRNKYKHILYYIKLCRGAEAF
jgi:hypothetical protein